MSKKIPFLFLVTLLFAMCKTPKLATDTTTKKAERKKEAVAERPIFYSEQVKNDFRAVSEGVKDKFLNDYNAAEARYSILFFTKGFHGEEITVKNAEGKIFSDMMTTSKSSGLARNMRILNTLETEIYDAGNGKTIYINSEMAQKYKFIYVMKDLSNEDIPYKITYSDKLRPAK